MICVKNLNAKNPEKEKCFFISEVFNKSNSFIKDGNFIYEEVLFSIKLNYFPFLEIRSCYIPR